jgi:ATP-dependent Clp protease ATP-binding subunit ClpA
VFERLTDEAQRVLVSAAEEARAFGHRHIGTEHLAIGLVTADGVAARVLRELGIEPERLQDDVLLIVGPGERPPRKHQRLTPRSRKVLEVALREAFALGRNVVDTEHLLLGLVRDGDGVGARILADRGADAETVRAHVLAVVGDAQGSPREPMRRRAVERTTPRRAGMNWPAALLAAAASFAQGREREPAVRVTLADGERLDVQSIRPGVVGEIIGFVVYDAEGGTRLVLVRPEGIARADVTVHRGGRGFLGLRPEPEP